MRRASAIALSLGLTLLAFLAAPGHGARSQSPDGTANGPATDAPSLQEILEGPGLEGYAPDVLPPAPRPVIDSDIPAPAGPGVDFEHYPTPGEIEAFLDALEAAHPDLVETRVIGESSQGRPIRALRVTNELAPGDPDSRPVMYIDGQHHARELIGGAVALYTAWWLVEHYGTDPLATHLLDTRTLYCVPSVNPDGNAIALTDNQAMRRTANPACCDDDGDGQIDEDPTEGYGYGSHTVILYRFDLEWADAHPDDPFVDDWRQHLEAQDVMGRFTGAYGGPEVPIPYADKDGDGVEEEDPVGGVDANRNYDAHWEIGDTDPRSGNFRGTTAFSEPETQAVRDLVGELEHVAVALSYHSGVDVILYPWGWSREAELPDAATFELLGRKGSELSEAHGLEGSPHVWTANGLYGASGSTMDYLYEARGIYAFSPEVFGGDSTTRVERVGATGTFTVGVSTAEGYNPPEPEILTYADRWHRFALYMMAAVPNIELHRLEARDDRLVLTLGNDGLLPAEVEVGVHAAGDATPRHVLTGTLQAGPHSWTLPLADLEPGPYRLALRAVLPVAIGAHEVERAEWSFRIAADGSATPADGSIRPWIDLGARFGGWLADARFAEQRYRCFRGCTPEIAVTAPNFMRPVYLPSATTR